MTLLDPKPLSSTTMRTDWDVGRESPYVGDAPRQPHHRQGLLLGLCQKAVEAPRNRTGHETVMAGGAEPIDRLLRP